MSHELLDRALGASDLHGFTRSELLELHRWYGEQLARLADALTPAAWFVSDGLRLSDVLAAVIEQGPDFLEAAVADPEHLDQLTTLIPAFPDAWSAHREDTYEDLPELPAPDWSEAPDLETWRAEVPRLAAASDARLAALHTAAGEEALRDLVAGIVDGLISGQKVPLGGLGTFSCLERRAFTGRNPATGEAVHVPARRIASFRPGPLLKAAVQDDGPALAGEEPPVHIFRAILHILRDAPTVQVPGLGHFVLTRRKPFQGTNPATGEKIAIPGRNLLGFRQARELERRLNPEPARSPVSAGPQGDQTRRV